jgi:hypothetical protein
MAWLQSPDGNLVACTDKFGRVLLLEVATMVIVRMWKGTSMTRAMSPTPNDTPILSHTIVYDARLISHERHVSSGYRDARVCWITSADDGVAFDKQTPVTAVFLVIMAQRRGLMEVWNVPFGERAAAFNVGVGSTLLPPWRQETSDRSCWLLRPDGRVYELKVPFSCSLRYRIACHFKTSFFTAHAVC